MTSSLSYVQKQIVLLSDDELLRILTKDHSQYTEEAIEYAKAELENRGIAGASLLEIEPVEADIRENDKVLKRVGGIPSFPLDDPEIFNYTESLT